MPLFQHTVVKKYLKTQKDATIKEKWKRYKMHFLNSAIQNNIRDSKEEQYQEGFLRDLFVKILGYTLNPDDNFNLTTELKNIKDRKKSDGGILVNNKVVGVIELKGTNTTDLGNVEAQAFGYKNNQAGCSYVITSNFEKLRFYIDNAIEHLEFNLFQLTEDNFKLLYLCLGYENLSKNLPKKIKEESISQEDVITKKLYKDYSEFKRKLFANLTQLNPEHVPLILFKKSQKLLDRFLFLFFAEDSHLLPPNSVRLILSDWKDLQERDVDISLYARFKKYFEYLNTGYKGKRYDVFPYNGGLFIPDTVLEGVKIDDDLLYKHTYKLSEYDFNSEIDVNILGHIFENSLNELEEITAQLEGQKVDKSKTKRKKDGVFYTPKYITKYIVENTVGKLCTEKKAQLQLKEEDYHRETRRQKKTVNSLLQKLKDYREWLLQLTICDPACGSGAFLNEALNFLITEHKYLDELEAKLLGGSLVFPHIENSILENNLFGVDINEESVEIAKLSLWLRTAQPNRKLNVLSNNIKCGNSLIDDPKIAGSKAFNWQEEFPQVFQEKEKEAWHITIATHDSRTSQRMIDYKVREKRDSGLRPKAKPIWLEAKDELLVTKTIVNIVKEDQLNVMAYNICGEHMHILLVCEEEEVSRIVQKIKAKTARTVNIAKGITTPMEHTREHTREHAPLPLHRRGKKQNSLWTQKFGCTKITDKKHLHNTIEYIKNNRQKHEIPPLSRQHATLVETMCCTYEQAFHTEYKGGFDVVMGNPPYVQVDKSMYNNYFTQKCSDLYVYFFEKGIQILIKDGFFGFITPSLFIKGMRYDKLREYLLNNTEVLVIDDLGDKVFDDVQMPTAITILRNRKIQGQNWNTFISGNGIIQKLKNECFKINEFTKIMRGLEIGKDKVNVGNHNVKFLTGDDIFRYGIKSESYISKEIYDEYKKDNYFFSGKRILIRETGNRITSIILESEDFQQNRSLYSIKITDENFNFKYVISIINSKAIQYYYQTQFAANTDIFPKIRIGQVKQLPIKKIPLSAQHPFIAKADQMLSLNKALQPLVQKFQRTLKRRFELAKLSKKLENWHQLEFADFIKELNKKIKSNGFQPLTLAQETEWEDFFLAEREKVQAIQAEITKTDKEIDQMVYGLYGLTEEEINIVENS